MTKGADWTERKVIKKKGTQQPPALKCVCGEGVGGDEIKVIKEDKRGPYLFIQQKFTRQLLSQTLSVLRLAMRTEK